MLLKGINSRYRYSVPDMLDESADGSYQSGGENNGDTVLVVNPSSGSGTTGKNWDNLYAQIKNIFEESPKVAFTKKSGDGIILTRGFLKNGFKNIVAIGGDGLINEVANGFFSIHVKEERRRGRVNKDTNVSINDGASEVHEEEIQHVLEPVNPNAFMAIMPCGTRNVIAKSLDLPSQLEDCCQRIVNGNPVKIDVISAAVTQISENDTIDSNIVSELDSPRIFLNAAEIGVGAEIIDRSKKIRDTVKSRILSTVTSMIATIPTYSSNVCELSVDEGRKKLITKMTMAVVANGRYLGGGFMAAAKAHISDGLLDVVVLKNSGSLKMLDEFVKMRGDDNNNKNNGDEYTDDGNMLYTRAKKLSMKSVEQEKKDITVVIDGEPIGILPATFQVHSNALNLKM
ncbi:MAG TPA: diacylglycerol kinase family protein [Nitrososphaeraceae archaeon]|nr:diacylglycerol kinase family protein [Nitrososphaeraceae archaeon]